eukprot:1147661-Pelagomonas_calceolata.AAC.4
MDMQAGKCGTGTHDGRYAIGQGRTQIPYEFLASLEHAHSEWPEMIEIGKRQVDAWVYGITGTWTRGRSAVIQEGRTEACVGDEVGGGQHGGIFLFCVQVCCTGALVFECPGAGRHMELQK